MPCAALAGPHSAAELAPQPGDSASMLASLKAAGSYIWCTSITIRWQQPNTPLSPDASVCPVLGTASGLHWEADRTWVRVGGLGSWCDVRHSSAAAMTPGTGHAAGPDPAAAPAPQPGGSRPLPAARSPLPAGAATAGTTSACSRCSPPGLDLPPACRDGGARQHTCGPGTPAAPGKPAVAAMPC